MSQGMIKELRVKRVFGLLSLCLILGEKTVIRNEERKERLKKKRSNQRKRVQRRQNL